MAKRRAKTHKSASRHTSRSSHSSSPGMIIQFGVVFIILAAILLASYVGGLYGGR